MFRIKSFFRAILYTLLIHKAWSNMCNQILLHRWLHISMVELGTHQGYCASLLSWFRIVVSALTCVCKTWVRDPMEAYFNCSSLLCYNLITRFGACLWINVISSNICLEAPSFSIYMLDLNPNIIIRDKTHEASYFPLSYQVICLKQHIQLQEKTCNE